MVKRGLIFLLFLMLFITACGNRNNGTDTHNNEPYAGGEETPPYAPLEPPEQETAPPPDPPEAQTPPLPEVITYESGIRRLMFTIEQPPGWDLQVSRNRGNANDWLLFKEHWDHVSEEWISFEIWESSVHPRNWQVLFENHISLDHPGMQLWTHPEAVYDVFTTSGGITVVEYKQTSIPWSDDYTASVFVMRRDGSDYREFAGTQLYFTAVLFTSNDLFCSQHQKARGLIDSLRFYDSASVHLAPSEEARAIGITQYNFPRIDGSTSTAPVIREIIRAMYEPVMVGSPRSPRWGVAWHYEPWRAARTIPAYGLLIAGYTDMIIVPDPSAYVLALAEAAGVELEFIPIGVEALVFITHEDNPVDDITLEQVLGVYAYRTITNWAQLGGRDGEIIPLSRNPHSGSQTQMDNQVLAGRDMHPSLNRFMLGGMQDMLTSVTYPRFNYDEDIIPDDFALGFTVYFYLRQMQVWPGSARRIKPLSLNGVFPSHETILSGAYPLATHYFAVVRADSPPESPERRIITWLLTPEGQNAVHAAGIGRLY